MRLSAGRASAGVVVRMSSRKCNVDRRGRGGVFGHFRYCMDSSVFGRRDANVNLSLMGRRIRLRGKGVSLRDGIGRKSAFAVRFLGKGSRFPPRARFVLSSCSRHPLRPGRGDLFLGSSCRVRRSYGSYGGGSVLMMSSGGRLLFFLRGVLSRGFQMVATDGNGRKLRGTVGCLPGVVIDSIIVPRVANVRVIRGLRYGAAAYRVPVVFLDDGTSIRGRGRKLGLKMSSCVAGPFDTDCLAAGV